MPVIHYFKSKKTQKVSGAFNGFLQVLIMQIMQSLPVEASRPPPEQGKVKFNWFHIRVSRYAFLFLSIRIFGSIWKYRMQWFSWRTCTVRAARTLSAGGTNSYGRPGTCPPREICKIGVSKMQFAAFPGPELGNRNFDRNHLFFFFRLYALHN